MTLKSLDIPEEAEQLAGWLERQLAGPDLGRLAAELSAIENDAADGTSLDQLFHDQLSDVLANGLGSVSNETLRSLLRQPALLLELQERVLRDGGAYWDGLFSETDELNAVVQRGRAPLNRATATSPSAPTVAASRPWYSHPLFVSCTTAAVVLIAVFVIARNRTEPPATTVGWGWAKPGALPEQAEPAEYFQQLADGADEWYSQRPETPRDVAVRLAQFRQGCTVLILAEHKPLSPDDRRWLVDKCKLWAAKLDAHLVDLESDRPAIDVRGEIDATIRNLISALRDRAADGKERNHSVTTASFQRPLPLI
jgi:hypothetical protein